MDEKNKKAIQLAGTVFLMLLLYIGLPLIYSLYFYDSELKEIERDLNKIENAKVANIWGHEDITLEEISARLKIRNKGEIVLNNLSSDVYNYPHKVYISEIGGYSFTVFYRDGGVGSYLDVGSSSPLGKELGIKFPSPKDVVDNYDRILELVRKLKKESDLNYFHDFYLAIEDKASKDQDPLYVLYDVDDKFEFAKTLEWPSDVRPSDKSMNKMLAQ